jgi:cysteinyl-tRNA synthetase
LNKSLASNQLQPAQAATALATWRVVGEGLFGLNMPGEVEIPADVAALFEERQAARKAKDFKKSDAIRAELLAKGWGIEDTTKGPRLKKI